MVPKVFEPADHESEVRFSKFKMADKIFENQLIRTEIDMRFLWSLITEFCPDSRSRCWRTKFARIQHGGSKMADGIL